MSAREKIIYIDDEEFNLLLFQFSFKNKYEVITTDSPTEAIEIIKNGKIKVVITDYKMPEMNGMELISKIKLFNPGAVCMVLSAYLENDVFTDKTQVYKYIMKPYKQAELEKYIEEALVL